MCTESKLSAIGEAHCELITGSELRPDNLSPAGRHLLSDLDVLKNAALTDAVAVYPCSHCLHAVFKRCFFFLAIYLFRLTVIGKSNLDLVARIEMQFRAWFSHRSGNNFGQLVHGVRNIGSDVEYLISGAGEFNAFSND